MHCAWRLTLSVSIPMLLFSAVGHAEDAMPNVEVCTRATWGYLRATDYEYGTVNTCSYPVEVWFMAKSGEVRHGTAAAGEAFRTGLKLPAFDHSKGWVAATCPAGFDTTVPVSKGTWDSVANGAYQCKKP